MDINMDTETTVKYDGEAKLSVHVDGGDYDTSGHLFTRIDFHKDGSQTVWQGIELDDAQYLNVKQCVQNGMITAVLPL